MLPVPNRPAYLHGGGSNDPKSRFCVKRQRRGILTSRVQPERFAAVVLGGFYRISDKRRGDAVSFPAGTHQQQMYYNTVIIP